MRTKALLLGAVIGAASLTSSMAQVYSVNIVGYINVTVAHGWSLVANQLNNSAGNTVVNLMPAPPTAISVYTYDATRQSYNNSNWDTDFQEWDDPSITVNPGQGMFIKNAGTNWTLTMVGEVMTGSQTHTLVRGWQLIAPIVPQSGLLQTDLGYVPSAGGDSVYTYDSTLQRYNNYNYDADFQMWDEEPNIQVGQGMFILRTAAGSWTRTFNVN